MKYQIDTIPVWEALELRGPCPLCALHAKTEAGEIKRVLGASVMEPDVRVRTNETGICREHQRMMFAGQNRLGHALLMDTHAAEVLGKITKLQAQAETLRESGGKLFERRAPGQAIAVSLRTLAKDCVVCEAIDTHMARYLYTFVYLWKNDVKFQTMFRESGGVCLPHAADLIEAADDVLNAQQRKEFTGVCLRLLAGPSGGGRKRSSVVYAEV